MVKKRLLAALLVLYWGALITATSIPASGMPELSISDKLQHAGAYLVLALLVWSNAILGNLGGNFQRKPITASAVVLLLYGAVDELHQVFIPGRSADPADWLADAAGVTAGLMLAWLLQRVSAKRQVVK